MLTASGITYVHPDQVVLFSDLSITVRRREKAALVGDNGTGKSTLLRILAGLLPPSAGSVRHEGAPYYLPQHFGQFSALTVAAAMRAESQLAALSAIAGGDVSPEMQAAVGEDWDMAERCREALSRWGLPDVPFDRSLESLSGGEKTRIFLAGIAVHRPSILLMDEPTNHLDAESRAILFHFIADFSGALLVVTHDRELLGLLNPIWELSKRGLVLYGGGYDLYEERKALEEDALLRRFEDSENALKKARRTEREATERKQRQDVRGKRQKLKEGVPRIALNQLRNSAENSAARLKDTHAGKIAGIEEERKEARQNLPEDRRMKLDFENSNLHTGKILVEAENLRHSFGGKPLWTTPLGFCIRSGERIRINGANGSGKTTLIRLILGELQPSEGAIRRAAMRTVAIDQDYSLIEDGLTVLEQAQKFNRDALPAHEIGVRLDRFLFSRTTWRKPCAALSGGEKLRLSLCCLMIGERAPDLFVLDEPTNNLDIRNIEILTAAVNDYAGTLLAVSHDLRFLADIGIEREINVE